MRLQGRLANWNDDKGFGFVQPNGGGERAFVHIKAFKRKSRRPVDGDVIVYQQVAGRKGPEAKNVQLVSDRKAHIKAKNKHQATQAGSAIHVRLARLLSPVFALTLVGAYFLSRLSMDIIVAYLALSLLTFTVYAWDKSAAQANRWRTKESTLHLLALCGGWPGAFYAQQLLRHKSSKLSFLRIYSLCVLANISAFLWFFVTGGWQLTTDFLPLLK